MKERHPSDLEVVWHDSDGDGLSDQREIFKAGALIRTEEDRGLEGFVEIPAKQP